MRSEWYPNAERKPYPKWPTGAFRDAENRKAVWHKTQGGDGVLNWYNTSGGIPHFTVLTTGKTVQHYGCSQYSRALRNMRGGVETNTDGAIQIEIVGYAGEDVTAAQRIALTRLCDWLTQEDHVAPVFPMGRPTKPYRVATNEEWDNGRGHFGHGQVPEQDHTDPDFTDSTWQAVFAGVTGSPMADVPVGPVDPAPVVIDRTLRRGDSGPQVKLWQQIVMGLGFDLPEFGDDSHFGEETETATRLVDESMGLAVDGIVSVPQARMAQNILAERPTPAPVPISDESMVKGQIVGALEDLQQARERLTSALQHIE